MDGDEKVFDHSEQTLARLKAMAPAAALRTYPSVVYEHGMTATNLRTRMLHGMAPQVVDVLRRTLAWLRDPEWKPRDKEEGFPVDWIQEILRRLDGR
jgi:hypothetical protein